MRVGQMSEFQENERKAYEQRLQRRLHILKDQFEAGRLRLPPDPSFIESLKRIRYASDGSVDLSTVDGFVRSLALSVEFFHDRDEIKKMASLAEIQRVYFTFLEQNFGPFYEIMIQRKLTPHDMARGLSQKESSIAEVTGRLSEFLAAIVDFWTSMSDTAHAHVEDMHDVLKGVFGGDLFPYAEENIASKCGLYTDTLVLPDPFMRSKDLFDRWEPRDKAYYLIKHGLNLLQYRELACAEVSPPIVVILPDRVTLDDNEAQIISDLSRGDALIHAAKIFGKEFQAVEEFLEYAGALDSVERAASAVRDPSRVLFDVGWEGSVEENLRRAAAEQHGHLLQTKNPGMILAYEALGRMAVSNEILLKASRLHGTPIIDAPTAWQYFVWKLEYDAGKCEKSTRLANLHIVRGLQAVAENRMKWLGRVPPAALIETRKTGAIDEIRKILGKGIEELATANASDFGATSEQILKNIQAAFADHEKAVAELRVKKWKFAGSDIGSWLVVGSLAVAAAATGTEALGLAALAAEELIDAPKLRDIPQSAMKLVREGRALKKSPVGLLFRCSRDYA